VIEGAGFDTPESVLYDPEGDVYLVSNINGGPGAKDGNGFISRISPDGEVLALKWIDGEAEGVTLNAPKGSALAGDELFVADINTVRIFDRSTGAPVGEVAVDGAAFLNDVAAAEDGTVYVSDSGAGTIHRLAPDRSVELLAQLGGVNGVFVHDGTLYAAAGAAIYRVGDDGQPVSEHDVPNAGLDGLILLDDGAVIVSSWGASAVYLIDADGQVSVLFGDLPAPADIGYDAQRQYVLIPFFNGNKVEARPLP
jgi:sugar lactone lactonase YvrE